MRFRDILMTAATQGGGPLWTPTDLGASLLAFWDATRSDLITLSGSNVTTWLDNVAALSLTQATSSFKPTYSATSFNGHPGVTFDGTDDHISSTTQPFPTEAASSEIWVVADQPTPAGGGAAGVIFGYGGASSSTNRIVRRLVGGGSSLAGALNYIAGVGATGDFTGRHVIRGRFDPTLVGCTLDSGAESTAAASGTISTTRVRMGSTTQSAASFFLGTINAVLVTGPLNAAQVAQLRGYLLSRGV